MSSLKDFILYLIEDFKDNRFIFLKKQLHVMFCVGSEGLDVPTGVEPLTKGLQSVCCY